MWATNSTTYCDIVRAYNQCMFIYHPYMWSILYTCISTNWIITAVFLQYRFVNFKFPRYTTLLVLTCCELLLLDCPNSLIFHKHWLNVHTPLCLMYLFWRYLTRGRLIWHLCQSSIRPSLYFCSVVKSRSNPFLEPTST